MGHEVSVGVVGDRLFELGVDDLGDGGEGNAQFQELLDLRLVGIEHAGLFVLTAEVWSNPDGAVKSRVLRGWVVALGWADAYDP